MLFHLSRRLPALVLASACSFLGWRLTAAVPLTPGLLFYLSGEQGTTADFSAAGTPVPTFDFQVTKIRDGAKGAALSCGDVQRLAYLAPGNIYAQRGTLSLFWRSRYPVGPTAFPIFRVGYADHSSWDMTFLRIDWNGHGFDAFVTDASLSRTRVSVPVPVVPGPQEWMHLALAWDENRGIRFYINGRLAAKIETKAIYNAGLNQFGPFSRIIAPWQVQSDYNFVRGGDIDEVRIYDRMVSDENVATLAKGDAPASLPPLSPRAIADATSRQEWWFRYGFNRPDDPPPELPAGRDVSIRKVEIHEAYDLKRWYWKALDGIRETTWPGVYNRSRLPGRNDYFQLPDWDCYSLSGKSITFFMPDEPWNQIEISGAAWGTMSLLPAHAADGNGPAESVLFQRPEGQEKTVNRLAAPLTGRKIRFDNVQQEQPIGELTAYYVTEGREPAGSRKLSYLLVERAATTPDLVGDGGVGALQTFIAGRYPADERFTLMAQSEDALSMVDDTNAFVPPSLPLTHILIPDNWDKITDGLDGIAIDLPGLRGRPTHRGLIPLNIQVKDPLWPLRNMFDFTFSVKPDEAKTLWLDLRDRILPEKKGLWIAIAAADGSPLQFMGAKVRLVFKPRAAALAEHELDRFTQARDSYANLVEEHPFGPKYDLWNRFQADITDVLRVDPNHYPARNYWAIAMENTPDPKPAWTVGLPDWSPPAFHLPEPPAGVPLWAFRQVDALRRVKYFVNWWIDQRQVENGEFGGGLSDDTDLTNTWPGVGLMGCDPDKLGQSLRLEVDACYRQGMITNGLCTIQADELHSYEEGLNSLGQNMILNYGSPRMIERAMENAHGIERISGFNVSGFRFIKTSYYNGLKMATDDPWGYAKAYSYLSLQPTQLLVDYNGNPEAKQVLLELADGLLSHRHQDASGHFTLPSAIHFSDNKEAVATRTYFPWPLFWSSYKWTGDRKYLDPIFDGGTTYIAEVNANMLDLVDLRPTWGPKFLRNEKGGLLEQRNFDARGPGAHSDRVTGNEQFLWQLTGDKKQLETLYGSQIAAMALGEYINTVGHLWIDRVAVPYTELQRARLGGIALVRNGCFPGHVVSWRFHAPATELSAAILVPSSTTTEFKVVAYNLEPVPVHAAMTGWNIDPGIWEIAQGIDSNANDTKDAPDGALTTSTAPFGRSQTVELTLAPRAETVLTFRLRTPGTPYWQRPDLGLDPEDVQIHGREVRVTIHNVGSAPSPATQVTLRAADGTVLATERVPSIPAPLDLYPKFLNIRMTLAAGATAAGGSVEIDPDHQMEEITKLNNTVKL